MPLLEEQAEKLAIAGAPYACGRAPTMIKKNLREIGAGVYNTHSKA
jgi:hypothetical protein